MTTIGLITTGVCEHRALAPSLERAFADADVEFRSLLATPADSITSGFVSYPAPTSRAPTVVDKLVGRMAAELRSRRGPDFVFVIDDLELDNVNTPGHVTGIVRDAVRRVLGATPTHADEALFRERCSFHLLCPMVESYFYGEPASLKRAGARADEIISTTRTLEDFESMDLRYCAPPDERGHPWQTPDRARHPKRYLRFLALPDAYKETQGGCDALATLAWKRVFERQPSGLAYALALFDDIAEALEVPCPFPGAPHVETARRADGVLRNL
jgi:hypothetical protein